MRKDRSNARKLSGFLSAVIKCLHYTTSVLSSSRRLKTNIIPELKSYSPSQSPLWLKAGLQPATGLLCASPSSRLSPQLS